MLLPPGAPELLRLLGLPLSRQLLRLCELRRRHHRGKGVAVLGGIANILAAARKA
jgi:hypothetical protein